eukprot:TRINITY_DN9234_c0_g1_i1.p1 TRINITY_DN9234_c0_g1~~TRINITY_DN9234_c0_g1_i1.p1  ORF type:complete len:272 (+),score=61.47 TRINITY_DN9234_c0_g1_i1:73-888(+)
MAPKKPPAKELSVIVPAYNETENIRPLTERLFKATKDAGLTVEMLVVDDESKGSEETERIVGELAKEGYAVRIHCRKRTEGRGLSSAVLLGFKQAKYGHLLCMDADLQHEPESVPAVADPVMRGEAEFSVGSRNCEGGGVGFEWSLFRRIVSAGATLLSFPVARSNDPMSGFFCVPKEVLNRSVDRVNAKGFKIGLEIMARCRCDPVRDVPITFQDRAAGESKLSASQYRFYLEQLAALYWDKFGFGLVALLVFLVVIFVSVAQRAVASLR